MSYGHDDRVMRDYGRRDSYDDRDRDRGYDDERDRRSPPRERPPPRKYDRRDDYDDRDRDSRRGGGYDRDRRDDRRGGYRDRSYDRGNHRGDGRFGRSDYEGGYRRERRRSPPRNRGPRPEPNREARVYVWNLPWRTSWQDLKDHFRTVGEVVYADVMTDRRTGRSKGCGIVEFADKENVQKAIDTMFDTMLGDRRISVREDRQPEFGRGGGDRDRPPPRRDSGDDRPPRRDNTDNPELEKKMDDDLDNYFSKRGDEEAPAAGEAAPMDAPAETAEPAQGEGEPAAAEAEPAKEE
eukprot:CAMPEP_0197472512 /NCGR_PEP_ID=MMETSP1309-20131121/3732_1 /TAXON_ID=464262 /ORGANISM="Genus nov. species nov., Strain RCC998" /LENGTH=294 /DNA_ID=CAMNT_0043011113 /DNA_START=54 /DNA_END=938 /DNA_ORIENTATION=-